MPSLFAPVNTYPSYSYSVDYCGASSDAKPCILQILLVHLIFFHTVLIESRGHRRLRQRQQHEPVDPAGRAVGGR